MAKILITGANGAFGALASRLVIQAGHSLTATMRDPDGRNAESANALRNAGATVVEVDVTNDRSVAEGIEAAITALGGLDVLVNVAGVGSYGLSEAYTAGQLKRLFDINVFGVHRTMRAVLPTLRRQQAGLIINVSSLLGRLSMPFYGPYSATKFAVETLSDTVRAEVAQFGVDVVLVEPGGFPTSWIDSLVLPDDIDRLATYGSFADVPGQSLEGYNAFLASKPEQDPTKVASAILDLIQAPAGQRPQRTIVDFIGMAGPVTTMNDALAAATSGVYGAFGLGDMLQLRI
ncbi:SDR family NAD(P)-dependent oxidoreductase [Sphingomonas sp. BK235]|uniref:SDR family NAD(P)-dependent oxidoreductase n=1 Tax=Sphingomonas sp. BK235 TaxID=2512131 RepID=UPI001045669B|nr:SDR family NAD(P)-dependent oxidoreductase [Sphingomonas sp. BK235]TCP29342.1 NADP-dependent 3-hydroxy acid dehydrogenase YdfG [Sphingomonas sp. BK235]